jgi:hypothetical protein
VVGAASYRLLAIWSAPRKRAITARSAPPATSTGEMRLARRFFDEAVRLDPADARKFGFLAQQ